MKTFITFTLFLLSASLCAQDAQELVDKGLRQSQKGNHEQAVEYYTQAISSDPENLDAVYKRAFSYGILKENEKAIADYTTVIEAKPDFVLAYVSRGSCYRSIKKLKEALSDFDRAIQLDPENNQAWNNRGWTKFDMGDKDGACSDWKKSKKLGNDEAKIIMKNNDC